jgi:hypothetical protein
MRPTQTLDRQLSRSSEASTSSFGNLQDHPLFVMSETTGRVHKRTGIVTLADSKKAARIKYLEAENSQLRLRRDELIGQVALTQSRLERLADRVHRTYGVLAQQPANCKSEASPL